jgi:glycosyltransferase involved in cell wall biosynthesis
MRVLHFAAGNLYGGIETFLVTLARLRRLTPEVEPEFAVCFEGRLSEELRAADVPVHVLGSARVSRPWTIWRLRRRLRRLFGERRPEILAGHGCWPYAIAAPESRRAGASQVFWGHAIQSGRHWLERWAARHRPDHVITNSRATAASMTCLFRGIDSEVVYLPVAPPPPCDRLEVRQALRARLGVSNDTVVVLIACRLERFKGHTLLLDALGRLQDVPGWECWIAGGSQRPEESRYLAELQAHAGRLGILPRTRFLGQRTDIPHLMAAADIHCQPNVEPEAFGIAFVEAFHARLPVVTTAFGAALEIVCENSGVLVPPGDVERLAAALSELMHDRERRAWLGAAGPARAAALCDPESQMAQIERSLRECLCIDRQGRRGARRSVIVVPDRESHATAAIES